MLIVLVFMWTRAIIVDSDWSERTKQSYGASKVWVSFWESKSCKSSVASGEGRLTGEMKDVEPRGCLWKVRGRLGACSVTVLIRWPDVSSLFFTKLGELWEYATVACDSAKAFFFFLLHRSRKGCLTDCSACRPLAVNKHLYILSRRRPSQSREETVPLRCFLLHTHKALDCVGKSSIKMNKNACVTFT